MQAVIESLNRAGAQAADFGWPMLWQSSLLILAVFGIEAVLRRRVRAAVRYALWWVVLVKLLLPPSLALPTGLGWWLRPAAQPPSQPRTGAMLVTDGPASAPDFSPSALPPFVAPPREALSAAGLALVAAGAVSMILLVWMLVRWQQASRAARLTSAPPAWLERLFNEDQRALGLSRLVRLRLLDRAVSPAVCGLVRPVVLLPRLLVDRLPAPQLRAVLLHELVHLRRRDVWASCLQALLQVLYWWHPLLWLANARIRRVREEAVDDAVVVALRGEAEAYAPALLEVARFALQRPLATLGLVGILESRSFLRQRIERLLDIRPPRRSGLTFASAVCVVAFGALAVPMGQELAPAPGSPGSSANEPAPLLNRVYKVDPATFLAGLREALDLTGPVDTNAIQQNLQEFFTSLGADLAPPKSVFFDQHSGSLIVRATLPDMDAIETAVQALNTAPPQINIRATFLDLPEAAANEFWRRLEITTAGGSNTVAILTAAQAQKASQLARTGSQEALLDRASITTLSGRQAQIQVASLQTIVTNIDPQALTPPGVPGPGVPYLTTTLPLGSTLDVVAYVTADGYRVQLTSTPTFTEFLGYEQPTNSATVYIDGRKETATLPLPHFRVRSISSSFVLWDGQTALLSGPGAVEVMKLKDKAPLLGDLPLVGRLFQSESGTSSKRHLLVLLTPTIIDAAGNRVHTDDEVERKIKASASSPSREAN